MRHPKCALIDCVDGQTPYDNNLPCPMCTFLTYYDGLYSTTAEQQVKELERLYAL